MTGGRDSLASTSFVAIRAFVALHCVFSVLSTIKFIYRIISCCLILLLSCAFACASCELLDAFYCALSWLCSECAQHSITHACNHDLSCASLCASCVLSCALLYALSCACCVSCLLYLVRYLAHCLAHCLMRVRRRARQCARQRAI